MLASPRVRTTRLVGGAAFVLVAAAIFFGGGSGDDRLTWVGAAAVVLAAALVGVGALGALPVARLSRAGALTVTFLVALVTWIGASIWWSVLPDRSWAYLNRGVVYLAVLVVGLA